MADVRDVKKACMHYSTTPTPQNGRTPYTQPQEFGPANGRRRGGKNACIHYSNELLAARRERERETDTADAAM